MSARCAVWMAVRVCLWPYPLEPPVLHKPTFSPVAGKVWISRARERGLTHLQEHLVLLGDVD